MFAPAGRRGVSEIVVVILVFALIVTSVGALALYLFGLLPGNAAPNLDLRILGGEKGGPAIIFVHTGGQSVSAKDLVVRVDIGGQRYEFVGDSLRTSTGVFSVGENLVVNVPRELGGLKLNSSLIHRPSGVILASSIVTVPSIEEIIETKIWYFKVLSDFGIPVGTDIYTWPESIDMDAFKVDLNDSPEGVTRAYSNCSSDFGWGVYAVSIDGIDLSDAESLDFWVKSGTNFKVGIKDFYNAESLVNISDFGWIPGQPNNWQKVSIPRTSFTGVHMNNLYGVFVVTAVPANNAIYIDNVNWIFRQWAYFEYVQQGENIKFTDLSVSQSSIVEWNWDYGDDGTVDNVSRDPVWYNAPPGTHMVKLSVRDSSNNTHTYRGNVTVLYGPSTQPSSYLLFGGPKNENGMNPPLFYDGGDGSKNAPPWVFNMPRVDLTVGSPQDISGCWKMEYTNNHGYWGGFYDNFYPAKDISEYTHLSFWARSDNLGARFSISVNGGGKEVEYRVSDYITVGREWQEVLIPLSAFSSVIGSVNFKKVRIPWNITLSNIYTGRSENIYVDNIRLIKGTRGPQGFRIVAPRWGTVSPYGYLSVPIAVLRDNLYQGVVTLSVEGAPSGMGVTLSKESGIPGFESIMNISVTKSLSGVYDLIIRASDGSISREHIYTINVGLAENLKIYSDFGLLPRESDVYVWPEGCVISRNDWNGAPGDKENYYEIKKPPNDSYCGFGVVLYRNNPTMGDNFTTHTDCDLRFYIKISRPLQDNENMRIQLEDLFENSPFLDLSRYGFDNKKTGVWQEVVVPVSDFGPVDLEHMKLPFKITADVLSSFTYYVDYIRWTPQPTYMVQAPLSGIVPPGGTLDQTVNVESIGGYSQTLQLTATAPSGITVTFIPDSGTPTFSSTLRISVDAGVPEGQYQIELKSASGGREDKYNYLLKVKQPQTYTWTINGPWTCDQPNELDAIPGTVALWHMNEGSGYTVGDSSGNNNRGYFSGSSPKWTTGKFSKGLQFDYSEWDTGFIVYHSSTLDITGSFTIEFWINPSTQSEDWGRIIEKGESNKRGYGICCQGFSNSLAAGFYHDGWNETLITSELNVNSWTHVAVTFDNITKKLRAYFNGTLNAEKTCYLSPESCSNNLGVGYNLDAQGDRFNGKLDEMRILNICLPEENVKLDACERKVKTIIFENDTGNPSPSFGTISWNGSVPAGTRIEIYTSSSPDGVNWEAWSGPYPNASGSQIASSSARYIRWKAVLYPSGSNNPTLSSVTVSWQA